jgi:polar amino acid transport system substrate-binding protein
MAPRRTLQLIAATSLAATLTLAACGSSGSGGTGGSSTPPTASGGSSTVAASSTAASGAGSSAAGSSSAGSSSAAGSSSGAAGSAPASSASSPAASSAGSSSPANSGGAGTGATTLPAACTPDQLQTKKAGTLTIATDQPVYEPWFVDNKPENGKGFEGAVAYAVADTLGYSKDRVSWVRASFDSVISPAPKNFDFDINEFSITPDRAKVVDFSSGYYDVTQAVVTTKDSTIAKASTVAELKNAHLGAQIGTTSLNAINDVIQPSQKPAVFSTNDDAVKALQNGQIDGIVTDLPTAFYMSGAQLDNGVLVGQLPSTGEKPEQFGLLLEKDSPITSCVSAAVDALRADGTLADLAQQWLTKSGAPELK